MLVDDAGDDAGKRRDSFLGARDGVLENRFDLEHAPQLRVVGR